jgi:hypothetical protein
MTTPPITPAVQPGKKNSKVKAIAITLVASVLLAGGSCFGFLSTMNFNRSTPISLVFAIGFGLGVLAFSGACIWAAVAFFIYFFSSDSKGKP